MYSYVMLCYAMLCYVMLCYVMLCLCYVMLCYVMSRSYSFTGTVNNTARSPGTSRLNIQSAALKVCYGWCNFQEWMPCMRHLTTQAIRLVFQSTTHCMQ